MSLQIDRYIADIELCETCEDMDKFLHGVVNSCGFASYSFLYVDHSGRNPIFFMTTVKQGWIDTYQEYDFADIDPVVLEARRTNRPFMWSKLDIFRQKLKGKKKRPELCVVAARDYGYFDSLVVPFHYVDGLGCQHSSCCALFWEDDLTLLPKAVAQFGHELHLILLYWAQKLVDITHDQLLSRQSMSAYNTKEKHTGLLTGRERDVLSWAGRGKTMSETATILTIAESTVETHLRNCMNKLEADNKTHAVAKAIYMGAIDL